MSINDWKVVEEAGEGRVGRTFVVCRDEAPERLFVLKLWRNDQPGIGKDVNRKEAAIPRLGMENTPGRLPSLIEEGEWHGIPFFVMERIEGVDYPVPDRAYRAFCVEAFRALGELHGWIYHCDLTPSHLGWKDGKIAFIDFDNALTPEDAPRNKDGIGTDPYIAPEVASRGEVSTRSDIYSLAMILDREVSEEVARVFRAGAWRMSQARAGRQAKERSPRRREAENLQAAPPSVQGRGEVGGGGGCRGSRRTRGDHVGADLAKAKRTEGEVRGDDRGTGRRVGRGPFSRHRTRRRARAGERGEEPGQVAGARAPATGLVRAKRLGRRRRRVGRRGVGA